MPKYITIKGARVHNLKNISLKIPRDKLVVITGLSGSGKSSLAFDTLYAEGQRRYVESLSSYARQFLGLMEKPDVDQIDGLSPAIAIDQKSASRNPRSTVGTVTEIYDYLRLLFARVGKPHCPKCGLPIKAQSIDQIREKILTLAAGSKFMILAPTIRDRKGEHKRELNEIKEAGFVRVRLDKTVMETVEALDSKITKNKRHSLEVVVDRLVMPTTIDKDFLSRLAGSLETALDLGDGLVIAADVSNSKDYFFSQHFACKVCAINLPIPEPRHFSFNSPHGACQECAGLGVKQEIDPDLIAPNKNLSIAEGAIHPWMNVVGNLGWQYQLLKAASQAYGFSLNVPFKKLSPAVVGIIFYGNKGDRLKAKFTTERGYFETKIPFEGVIRNLERRYRETKSDYIRKEIERYMRKLKCPVCQGKRLKPESLAVKVLNKNIIEITELSIAEAVNFFNQLTRAASLEAKDRIIASQILKEISKRLRFLFDVGLAYLTLSRSAASLSGGEAQRIRLATQIGSSLSGVLYILDEPSIGLHQRDNQKLIKTLKNLRDLGNTVIVVEHDEETMRSADWLIDVGPGAGREGGRIVACAKPLALAKNKSSLTGRYLSGELGLKSPRRFRVGSGRQLKIIGATEFNLKKIDVAIPLGKLIGITGVSGSGKSTLIHRVLSRALRLHFYKSRAIPGRHKKITGLEYLDKVISIDQSPIGRTPRSNPATYTAVFNYIRDLFASTPEAKIKGYRSGRFSFNVKGGRCEACRGEGLIKVEMNFLPDVYVECDECKGRRYNQEALAVYYKEKNIADVLKMTVADAYDFFINIPQIKSKLKILKEVGLGYIELGQPATTLSGGEAQRVKLATELAKRATGKTLYILDEPTTGLHFADVEKLLVVLNCLVDKGNTVLVIEHNLDIIKSCDWLIDLGPEGGEAGGYLVASGTPRQVAKIKASYTGQYLKRYYS